MMLMVTGRAMLRLAEPIPEQTADEESEEDLQLERRICFGFQFFTVTAARLHELLVIAKTGRP